MIKIKDYVLQLLEDHKSIEVADMLEVSQPMISAYKSNDGFNASLAVAITVYKKYKIVLFPFSEEALKELSHGR